MIYHSPVYLVSGKRQRAQNHKWQSGGKVVEFIKTIAYKFLSCGPAKNEYIAESDFPKTFRFFPRYLPSSLQFPVPVFRFKGGSTAHPPAAGVVQRGARRF
jgi:hypothetical protein